ncbi:uncharacterized protein LOC110238849 [Exaiptasia diaphana]|uniref:C2H2-type domain-containing protein n=1 Tax=Exaiptasia diaphana TaxID=2652724 RepID=A0A913X7J2_EXADI|nr:uncharacterized protein LOC110238849 [Exaiptasia diaphana]
MDFSYVVLLKPSDIRFTTNAIPDRFDNNIQLTETLLQLQNKEITMEDIPRMQVVWSEEHWEWYTLNNRRLWVFQQLEKDGQCKLIKTHRLEDIKCNPKMLYGSVHVKTRGPQTLRREVREVSITSSRCSSPEKTVRGHGKYEYLETQLKIELSNIVSEDSAGYRSYHETRTCKYSEFKQSRYSRPPSKSCHRHHPYKTSALAKLVPSERFYARAQQLQNYRSYKTHGQRGRVYGIVSYGFWRKRRREFFEKFYSVRSGRLRPKYLPDVLHTCGVCYRSFKRRVSLEQHCEELLHYACVPCGRFFTSITALGQHRNALDHYLP